MYVVYTVYTMNVEKKEKEMIVGFTGSSDISSVKNDRNLQLLFRDMFHIAYNNILPDMYCKLLIGSSPGMDAVVYDESTRRHYPIETHRFFPWNKKIIDDCDVLIAICINRSEKTLKNIQYAKDEGKRVLEVYL